MKIMQLDIEGFMSLRKINWFPGNLNVIIGPNGAGKSNLLYLLELIASSAQGRLGKQILSSGGMEVVLWDGAASSVKFSLKYGGDSLFLNYMLELTRLGYGSSYKIERELLTAPPLTENDDLVKILHYIERNSNNAVIKNEINQTLILQEKDIIEEESILSIASVPFISNRNIASMKRALDSITVYHDFSTGKGTPVRQSVVSRMEKRVEPDGQNLISVLHTLYTGDRQFKKDIDEAMRVVFGDEYEELVFPPASDHRIQMRIRWNSLRREQSVAGLSDGTLRFLFLLTIFASEASGSVIAIDEPETGLHPSMFPIIAEFAAEASTRSQVILTTHSPQFLDSFKDIRPTTTVAKWENGETKLQVLNGEELDYWLQEYSLGSLYQSGELEQMV